MPRTIVPQDVAPSAGGPGGGMRLQGGDDLPTKLVKYVPAEAIAFFVPVAALIGTGNTWLLIAALIIGAAGTAGWLWYNASSQPPDRRPFMHFYVLSVVAFLLWAIATSPNVASMARVGEKNAGVLLLFGVFLIPLADGS